MLVAGFLIHHLLDVVIVASFDEVPIEDLEPVDEIHQQQQVTVQLVLPQSLSLLQHSFLSVLLDRFVSLGLVPSRYCTHEFA